MQLVEGFFFFLTKDISGTADTLKKSSIKQVSILDVFFLLFFFYCIASLDLTEPI